MSGREGIRRTFRYSLFLVASQIRGLALSKVLYRTSHCVVDMKVTAVSHQPSAIRTNHRLSGGNTW